MREYADLSYGTTAEGWPKDGFPQLHALLAHGIID